MKRIPSYEKRKQFVKKNTEAGTVVIKWNILVEEKGNKLNFHLSYFCLGDAINLTLILNKVLFLVGSNS